MELCNLENLREMLIQECKLRNSPLIQKMYDAVSVNFNSSECVEDFVQNLIISKSKFPHLTITQYRDLLSKNREALKDDAFFIKHNIMKPCPIAIGDLIPLDIGLYNLELKQVKFGDILNNKKTIILASSST